jgi:hypothetical protein
MVMNDRDREIIEGFNSDFHEPKLPLEELARLVDEMQAPLYNGRGHQTMQAAVGYLERGDLYHARTALYNNWDKFNMLEDVKDWLVENGLGPKPLDFDRLLADED